MTCLSMLSRVLGCSISMSVCVSTFQSNSSTPQHIHTFSRKLCSCQHHLLVESWRTKCGKPERYESLLKIGFTLAFLSMLMDWCWGFPGIRPPLNMRYFAVRAQLAQLHSHILHEKVNGNSKKHIIPNQQITLQMKLIETPWGWDAPPITRLKRDVDWCRPWNHHSPSTYTPEI